MAQKVRFGEYVFLYNQVLRQMLRLVLWLPVFLQGGLAILLAIAHHQIFSPVISPLLHSWVQLLYPNAADAFFRFPEHYLLLPLVFSGSARIYSLIFEAFFFGVYCDLMISLYRGEKPIFMQSARKALSRYLQLALSWAVLIVILYLVSKYFYAFVEDVLGFSLHTAPRRQFLAFAALHGLTVLIYVPFIFIIPAIMAGRQGWLEAVKKGFGLAMEHPIIAFGITAVPYTIAAIPALPLSYARRIIDVFNPELVFQIMLVAIAINIIANFILMGTSLKFFMDKTE